MPHVVITGGPGVGKTTLLLMLASLGYRTVAESARAIIAERKAQGLPPRPSPIDFATELLRLDTAKYRNEPNAEDWTFFDRSAVEALGMLHEARRLSPTELQSHLAQFEFHRQVFMLPPWHEIYTRDSERDHSFDQVERVHASLKDWYTKCGYHVHEVPRASPVERATHVLQALSQVSSQ